MATASLTGLSAAVTRILSLTGFPKELKTKDIQTAFSEWDQVGGGFKIKWKDDTSLYIVFQDPGVAKRAYLKALAIPPPILTSSSTGIKASIVPYNGSEAQSVIAAVQSRTGHTSNASRSGPGQSGRSQSISTFPTHRSSVSKAEGPSVMPPFEFGNVNGHATNIGREPSPTLPNLPAHPSLNDLISSASSSPKTEQPNYMNANSTSSTTATTPPATLSQAPRIGDPGKRMVGAALGVRHPSLGQRVVSGGTSLGLDRPMGALSLND